LQAVSAAVVSTATLSGAATAVVSTVVLSAAGTVASVEGAAQAIIKEDIARNRLTFFIFCFLFFNY
jgi:hypothetical protein